MIRLAQVLGTAVLFVATLSTASTYYVSATNGDDHNSGQFSMVPWAHFPYSPGCQFNCAAYSPAPGDHFTLLTNYVLPSTWKIPAAFHGASANPITITGSTGVVITGMKTFIADGQWTTSSQTIGHCPSNTCVLYSRSLPASSYYDFESLFYRQLGASGPIMRRPRPSSIGTNRCAPSSDTYVCQPTNAACNCPTYSGWQAGTVNAGAVISDANGNLEVASCATQGAQSCGTGGLQPSWPTANVYTVTSDGTVKWTMAGKEPTCAKQTATCSTAPNTHQCFNRYQISPSLVSQSSHARNIGDIEIKFHKIWAWSDLRVSSITTLPSGNSGITFSGPDPASGDTTKPSNDGCLASEYPPGTITGHLFMLDNVREQLNKGQWYLDRCPSANCPGNIPEATWTLYIAADPTKNENPNSDTVSFPQVNPASPQLVIINDAHDLTFSNIIFEGDNYVPPPQGLPDSQGMPLVPAAISVRGGTNIVFDAVQIQHSQAKGVEFVTDENGVPTTLSQFTNGACQDIGAGCVFIGEAAATADTDSNVPSGNTVSETLCNFPHQVEPSGEGTGCVYIGDAHDNTVTHNDCIGSLGGCFDLGHGLNRGVGNGPDWNNYFMYGNQVSLNTGSGRTLNGLTLGLLNDIGVLYAADNASSLCPVHSGPPGIDKNTYCNLIEGNVFHDMATDFTDTDNHQGTCIYLDQGSSYNYVDNNVCYRISQEPVFNNRVSRDCADGSSDCLYIGQYNRVTNNILGACGTTKLVRNRRCVSEGGSNKNGLTVDHNIFFVDSSAGTTIQSKPGHWGAFDYQTGGNPPPNLNPTALWNFHHNLYWDVNFAPFTFITCQWDTNANSDTCSNQNGPFNNYTGVPWATTEDVNSLIGDPGLINPTYPGDNWNPTNTAKLQAVGFVPFTIQAGRTNTTIVAMPASTLWPLINMINPATDYLPAYNATARMTSPVPGSTFTSSTVTFQWSAGAQASAYFLKVGNTPGGGQYYSQNRGTNTSTVVNGLPINGIPIYVTLSSNIGGTWYDNTYTYTAKH